ncbi:agamous-like MADS-box protein AGL62 [Silene latifolia]|uniref:agamous-like MADS-box protein AGL62 n=1 Tax=Silene latifolia TaxID=37657 RepID=UPI003D783C6A
MATLARKSRGRQKVALKRMEKKSNRLVTFSKRRGGVFKKASELCTLLRCASFMHSFLPCKEDLCFWPSDPSVEAIINRFLLEDNNLPQDNGVSTKPFQNETLLRSNKEVTLLKDQIDVEKKRGEELLKERRLMSEEAQKFLAPAETFTLSELKQIQAILIALKNNVLTHGHNLVKAQPNLNLTPNPRPSILHSQNLLEQNPFLNRPNMLVG